MVLLLASLHTRYHTLIFLANVLGSPLQARGRAEVRVFASPFFLDTNSHLACLHCRTAGKRNLKNPTGPSTRFAKNGRRQRKQPLCSFQIQPFCFMPAFLLQQTWFYTQKRQKVCDYHSSSVEVSFIHHPSVGAEAAALTTTVATTRARNSQCLTHLTHTHFQHNRRKAKAGSEADDGHSDAPDVEQPQRSILSLQPHPHFYAMHPVMQFTLMVAKTLERTGQSLFCTHSTLFICTVAAVAGLLNRSTIRRRRRGYLALALFSLSSLPPLSLQAAFQNTSSQ
jgi:hypothetical protein